jgi:phage shock protein PspC (stress-responsive transcriptional regulator)
MICPYCRTENQPGATRCAACTTWMVESPPVREWLRAREGRMIAGVCRGLASRFGLPVAAIRLGFLASVLLGGWGILAYVVLWIAMPLPPRAALPAAPLATSPEGSRGVSA